MEKIIIAVPSENPGGLEAAPSGHFGHCDCYTLVELENGQPGQVKIVPNEGHSQGGCMVPVNTLGDMGVKVLVAGGMGRNPLAGFMQRGITVYHNQGLTNVGAIVQALIAGKLPAFSLDHVCGGSDGSGCGGH